MARPGLPLSVHMPPTGLHLSLKNLLPNLSVDSQKPGDDQKSEPFLLTCSNPVSEMGPDDGGV